MAENTISVRLVECAKTLDEWIELGSRVIPKKGEICLEYFNAGTDSDPIYRYKMKIGDGVHQYSQLKYFPVPEDITNSIVTWVEANLDVNEYAQAAIRNESGVNYIDISSIKEVDGKISGGTSLKFTVSAGNMLSINYNEASRTATISHNTITQNDTAGGDVSSGVITSISRDTSGHVTGVQKGTIPSSPDVSTVVAEGRTSTSDTSIRVDEPYINQLRGGGVRSSHQLKNGDNISVSSLRQGNYTDIVISHGSAGAGTESGTTDSGNQLNFGSNVVTGVTRDSKGHVTGVTTSALPNSPSAPEVRSSVTVDNQSVADSNTNVVNPFINQVLNGHVTSSHKVEGGTKINVSASPDGDNHLGNKVVIEHSTTTRQPDTEDSTSPTEVITGVTTDGTGHVTGVSFTSPDNLKVGLAKDLDYPVTSIDDGNMWNDRVTGGEISIGEDAAKLNPLKGNTIVWNQMITGGCSSDGGLTVSYNNGIFTITGTATSTWISNIFIINHKWTENHRYLVMPIQVGGTVSTKVIFYNGYNSPTASSLGNLRVYTPNGGYDSYMGIGCDSGAVFDNLQIRLSCFDLTKLFGSDEQICAALGVPNLTDSTNLTKAAENFEKLFPLHYYNYNEGELISLNATGIKSVGFNQWDEEWELGVYNGNTGVKEDNSAYIRSKNLISIISQKEYYLKAPSSGVGYIRFFDANKEYMGRSTSLYMEGSGVFSLPSDAAYIVLQWQGTTYNNDICINISDSSRNGTYEPYKKYTLDLDWIKTLKDSGGNLLFPNGLCGAGNAYDEVGEDYAIKRVGVVDLGSIDWDKQSGYFVSQNSGIDRKYTSGDILGRNLLNSKFDYIKVSLWSNNTDNNVIGATANAIRVYCDTSQYTDGNAFKTAMSGVMLYYELATPITIHFNKKSMYYVVDDKGTEQLLPVNDADPVTAPIRGRIEYKSNFKEVVLSTIDRVNNYKNPVRGVNNTSQNIGSVAVYDSDSTVHSSEYTISDATIIADDTSNSTTIPSIRAIVAYVQNVGQNALHYKGVIPSYAELMRITDAVPGDVWILSHDDTSSVPNKVYDAGDWFIRNVSNTGWDEIQGKVRVNNRNAALTLNGQRKILANIEGTDITVDVPNLNFTSQSASGTTITVVEDVSQSDGLISATRKTIRSASKTATGIVQFVSDIHNSTDDTKAVTAGDAWTEFSKRNVRALEVSTITEVPVSVNVFIATFPPSVSTPPENWASSMGVWTGAAHFVGQLYIDTRAGIAYIAVSTNNINGWKQITNS